MNIVQHPKIHEELIKRWDKLGLTGAAIARDAQERGMDINDSRISSYRNVFKVQKVKKGSKKPIKPKRTTLTATQLTWLCIRWGIMIDIQVGSPVIEDGKLKFKIPPYDELKSLQALRRIFPDNSNPTLEDISK